MKSKKTNNNSHVLYLYSSSTDKYSVFSSFLSGEKSACISDDPEIARRLKDVEVLSLKERDKIIDYKKIAIDASFIEHKRRGEEAIIEEFASHIKKSCSVLCAYDINKIDPKTIKRFVLQHDKLILSAGNTTMLSSKALNSKINNIDSIDNGFVVEFVKKELKTIVLALLAGRPMCGRDIQTEIYKKFNVLFSPGTLYPLLHELQKEGLLECEYRIKTKVYKPHDEEKIISIVNNHIKAKNFLNSFLESALK